MWLGLQYKGHNATERRHSTLPPMDSWLVVFKTIGQMQEGKLCQRGKD